MLNSIFWPVMAMVALVAVVWVRLFIDRIGEMRTRRIPAREVSTSRQVAATLEETKASDNFKNLFEVPVLFYVFCLAAHALQMASPLFVAFAWAYFLLRAIHSFIHCTYNNVNHRFAVYLASTLLLFAMWLLLGVALLSRQI